MLLKKVRIIVNYLIFNKKLNLLIYLISESEAFSKPF
jgi:hypothetical protein